MVIDGCVTETSHPLDMSSTVDFKRALTLMFRTTQLNKGKSLTFPERLCHDSTSLNIDIQRSEVSRWSAAPKPWSTDSSWRMYDSFWLGAFGHTVRDVRGKALRSSRIPCAKILNSHRVNCSTGWLAIHPKSPSTLVLANNVTADDNELPNNRYKWHKLKKTEFV